MSLFSSRRNLLQLISATPLLASPLAALAQALTPIKLVGAAAVARPDQGFMFAGIATGFFKELGIEGDFFTTAGSAAVLQLIATNQAQLGQTQALRVGSQVPVAPHGLSARQSRSVLQGRLATKRPIARSAAKSGWNRD